MKKTVFLFLIIILFYCTCVSSVHAQQSIKIGAIFCKPDNLGASRPYNFNGVELAVEEINKNGGVLGRPLEIVEFDNKGSAIGSKQAAQQAVVDGVVAVVGGERSSNAAASAQVLQRAGVPMITPSATNVKVSLTGDCIFRVCFTDPFQGKIMAKFAKQDLKAETAVILVNIKSDYSIGLAETFRNAAEEMGLKVVWQGDFMRDSTDFSDILETTQTYYPDVIFLPAGKTESSLIIKQARKMGINGVFLGADGWTMKLYKLAGDAVDGVYASNHWHDDVSSVEGNKLKEDYKVKYNEDMLSYIPLTYDAVMLMADAIERAGVADPKAIKKALSETKDFKGITGEITFDENGDPKNKEAVILKFDNGKTNFVKRIKADH